MARSELDPYGNNQTAASRVGQDQAAQSRIRAAQKNEFERNKTAQANAGANSLARASTFAAETTPRLGALTQRQSPLPAMSAYPSQIRIVPPAQADALLGRDTSNLVDQPDAGGNMAHAAGLAAAGRNTPVMTPYGGTISSRIPQAGESEAQGPSYVANNGVTHPAAAPFDSAAAHQSLYADPEMRGVFTAGTPENAAFVAHAQQFGPQSAFQNAASIVQQSRSTAQATSQQPGATPPAGPAGGVVGFQAGTAPVSKMNAYGATPPRPTGQPPTPLGGRNITAATEG